MTYERPTFEQKLKEKLEAKPYRPETIHYIGHLCRVGHVSAQTAINMLDVLEEDARMTAKEALRGSQETEGQYSLDLAPTEPQTVSIEGTELSQQAFRDTVADL